MAKKEVTTNNCDDHTVDQVLGKRRALVRDHSVAFNVIQLVIYDEMVKVRKGPVGKLAMTFTISVVAFLVDGVVVYTSSLKDK